MGNIHGMDANSQYCQLGRKSFLCLKFRICWDCTSYKIDLEKSDFITKIDLVYTPGKYLNAIEIFTTMGHRYGPYGGDRGTSHSLDHPGCKLSYLSGKNYVEDKHHVPLLGSLTFHFLCYGKIHNS